MQAKQIAAIIESCCRATLSQVRIGTDNPHSAPSTLDKYLLDGAFDTLCRAIAGNAAQILATDDDDSDGIPLQQCKAYADCGTHLDTGVTQSNPTYGETNER